MAQYISSQGFEYGVKHFINSTSGPLSKVVSEALEIDEDSILQLLNLGAIYVNNQRQINNSDLSLNQQIRVHTKPRRFNCDHDWNQLIVFENADFLVLNKPSGIPSHSSVDNLVDNALHQISLVKKQPLHITHRLDTLTEGLIVYAKTSEFVKHFNYQLTERLIEKKYVALAETSQQLPEKLIHYMEPSPRAPKKVSQTFVENWAQCELHVLKQKKMGNATWIKINLLTGRTHQIRAQLSEISAPLQGDTLYGSKILWKPNAIALRACELQFNWQNQRLQFNLDEELVY